MPAMNTMNRFTPDLIDSKLRTSINCMFPRRYGAPKRRRHAAVSRTYFASGLSSANFPLAAGAMKRRRNATTRAPKPSIPASAGSSDLGAT